MCERSDQDNFGFEVYTSENKAIKATGIWGLGSASEANKKIWGGVCERSEQENLGLVGVREASKTIWGLEEFERCELRKCGSLVSNKQYGPRIFI